MKSKVKVGIVGCGFAARFHYEAYKRVYGVDVDVVGVTSSTRESREQFAAERGIRAFESLEAMLPEVSVIDICAPPSTHEPMTVAALEANKNVIVEKPFTGFFGPSEAKKDFRGDRYPRKKMMEGALSSARRILDAERRSEKRVMYAENWVYAPSIQKEREILEKTGGQILWIMGEESHSGSHSPAYGIWQFSGGGSLMGKACHPLTAILYLKRVEGETTGNGAIRPSTVSARVHKITGLSSYRNMDFLRSDYRDVEDYAQIHITFQDGMVADVFSSELVLGGIHNWLEVYANNHRTRCNINPTNAMQTYNPKEDQFQDIYVVEKIGTKQGWSPVSPDEDWMTGYPQEIQDFMESTVTGRPPLSGSSLGYDVVATIYAAYLSAAQKGIEVRIPCQGEF